MTYEELTDEVIARTFPEGVAENLESIYRKRVLDGMIELQRWCPYFRSRQFTIVPFGVSLYRQGTSYISAPCGKVKRVASYTDDSMRDIVYYDPAERTDLDRWQQGTSRTRLYPEEDTVSDGYYPATPDVDKGYRAERAIFVVDNRTIAICPHLESGETVLVEWDGIVRTFDDADAVDVGDFEAQVTDALSLYLRKESALREDRNSGDYIAIGTRWKQALAGLKLDTKELDEPETPLEDIGNLPRPEPQGCSADYASNVGDAPNFVSIGSGDPEGVVTGYPGRIYTNSDDESVWVKKTGTGKTGWIEVIA